MTALPNPFCDGGGDYRSAAGQLAAPSPVTNPAAVDLLGSPIGDVGEIFAFARLLCAEARIRPGAISAQAVAVAEEIRAHEQIYHDPPPLFLRDAR